MLPIRLSRRGRRRPAQVRLARGVSTAAVEDGLTLFGAAGAVYHLNATGTAVLAALTAGGIGHAVDALTARYGLDAERARADVTALLGELRNHGLVSGQ